MIGLRRASIALAAAWMCSIGGCSSDEPKGDGQAVAVSVNALAPVNELPPTQTTNEDSPLTFSELGGNRIDITDADNQTSTVQITVTNGVFSLGTISGITVSGNGTSSVILSGPIVVITVVNNEPKVTGGIRVALNGARYIPAANFNGPAQLQMNSSDTNGEVAFSICDITVTSFNDAPVNNVPTATVTGTEDVPQAFTFSVNDVDVGTTEMVVTLTSNNGTLITLPTTTGLTFNSGDGTADASLSFNGTQSDINAALNGLTVTPPLNYIGPSTLVITSNDQGGTGAGAPGADNDTVNITWGAVNDAPVNGVPAAQATAEEQPVTFSSGNGNALGVNDADGPSTQVQVTLSATSGTLTLGAPGGVTFTAGDGTADATMTFRGTLSQLNAAIATTVFTPNVNFTGTAVLTMISNDLGNTGLGGAKQDTDTVNITVSGVNDAPVNSVPDSQITAEDVVEVFSATNGSLISFSDPDAPTLQVTLTAQNGTVTLGSLTGLTFQTGDGTADAVMSFTGTIAQVNSACATLSFRPTLNFGGQASLTILTSDRGASGAGGTLTDQDVIDIEVVPTNDAPDAVNDTLTIAEDADVTQVAVLGNDTGAPDVGETLSITQVGAPLHGTAAIDGTQVTYQPAANYTGPDSFTYTISDGNGGSDTASVAITVTSVNDAPTAQADSFTVLQGATTALSVLSNDSSAPDSGETLTITMVTPPAHGGAVITGSGSSISYTSTAGYAGDDTFSYTISDGNGGTTTADVTLSVQAVNTKPVNTLPGPQTVSEDSQLTFSTGSGNALSVSDSNNTTLTVQITVTHGTFTLGAITGLTVTGNGTASVSAQGTLSSLNNGLNNARFTPAASYFGSATLTMNSADTNGESDIDVLTLSVTSINDAPVNSVPTTTQTAVEDVPLTFGTISISDADVSSGQLRITLTADNGTRVTLSTVASLSFTAGDGVSDATMTFSGSLPSINAALNGLTVTSTSNYIGGSTLTLTSNDLGNSGVGGQGQDTDVINITWGSVNDPPVSVVPGAQAADEETPFTFAQANGNALRVSDLDVSGGLMQITLSVSSGTLTLGGTSGLSFSSGDGTADVSMAFTGTLVNVNTALEGVVFTPAANFNGAATLTLLASDLGNSGTGGTKTDTDTVTINVGGRNDAPVNTVPGAQTTNEDVARVFSSASSNAITVADIDATSLQLSLSASTGVLTLATKNGLTFQAGDGTADGSMTFTGAINSINAALNGLSYVPAANYSGMAAIAVLTSDLGASGTGGTLTDEDAIIITVSAVNDAPTATNDTATVDEDSPATSIAVLANDTALPDTGETLSITNLTMPAHGTAMISAGRINYQPTVNYQGADSFNYTISDGNGGTATATVSVTVASVNDAPVATADSFSVLQSSTGNVLGVLSNDNAGPDVGETLSIIGVTTPPNGAVAITGGGNSLSYTPNTGYTGADSFDYTLSDGNGGTASATVAITVTAVNTKPVNTLPLPQTVAEDTPLFFSTVAGSAITVADSNNTTLTVQISVTSGTFTMGATTGLTISGNSTANLTIQGTITAINNGLNNSRYNPSLNYSGGATLTIVSSDSTGETDLDTLTLSVTSFNDPPVNAVPVGTQAATEDTPKTFSNISVADVDVGSGVLQVTLTANNGTVITLGSISGLTFSSGDGVADASMAFTGVVAAINTALNGLSITTPANFLGATAFTIVTSDLGNTGAGPTLEDSDTINLNWASVNDPPQNSLPGDQATLEEAPITFQTGAITVSDADVGGGVMRITLTGTGGTVSLGNPGLVTFTTGDGTNDATMTFSGTLTALNTALDGTTYTPNLNFAGNGGITVVTNDQGNTGGAAQSDTDTIAIAVLPVNDAPVNNVPGTQTTNEEVTRTFSSTNGNTITLTDVDAMALQVTLSAENGTLTLGGITGLSFLAGDGTADASMTFTATIMAINTALSNLRFIPTPNFNGLGKLTILSSDQGVAGAGGARFDEDVIEINVNSINDQPDAIADAVTMSEDAAAQVLAVLANDVTAPDSGETLTITMVSTPAHGTASTDGTTVTYQPTANYGGADSFTYTVNDGNGGSDSATVSITVTPVNDAPDAADDSLQVAEGAVDFMLTVLANDTGAPDTGETLSITEVSEAAHGTLAIVNAGAGLQYTGEFAYFGADSFTYTISDGNGGTDTATVTLDVTSVDTQPAPVADTLSVDEDASGTVDVLANDTGLSDMPLVVTIATQGAHGTAVVQLDNTVLYTPVADYVGEDTFAYTVTDLDGDTANGDVTVTVGQVDDLPEATADSATTEEDTEVDIAVLDNDTRLVDMPVVVSIETAPEHGEAEANEDGTVTYTPADDYNGDDSFEYTVTDATGSMVTALVSVTITPVNDPPVAVADTATADPGVAVEIDVLGNDSDVDGDELTIDAVGESELGGELVITGDGTIRYTPPEDLVEAMETFTYTVIDGEGGSDTGTVVVSVGVDTDGDGLIDADENELGTDPANPDTDGDKIPDGLEVATTNTDPLDDDSDDDGVLDGNEDVDQDGMLDAAETDPNTADTDNDGVLDGTERGLSKPQGEDTDTDVFVADEDPSSKTDPRDEDTDGDGATDGEEDADGNGEVGENESDPDDDSDDGMVMNPPQGGMNGGGDGGGGEGGEGGTGGDDPSCEDDCADGGSIPPPVVAAGDDGGCRAVSGSAATSDSLLLALACALLWLRRRSR